MYHIDKDFKDLIVDRELYGCDELKNAIENTLKIINDERLVRIIRVFPRIKPTIKFQTLYCLFDEFRGDKNLAQEFEVMQKYVHYDFDVFTFVNCLKRTCRNSKDERTKLTNK